MPAPKTMTVRQKKFAMLVHEGIAPYEAYPLAGYSKHRWSPYRTLKSPVVQNHIRELERRAMKKHDITIDKIVEDLEQAKELARDTKQPAAMISAALGQAKVCGLIVDKTETKNVNDMDRSEVVSALREAYEAATPEERPAIRAYMRAQGLDDEAMGEVVPSVEGTNTVQ